MKKHFGLVMAFAVAAATFATGLSTAAEAKRRDQMTAAEKKELRKRAREWCMKKYVKGTVTFERVEIRANGQVICWTRQ